MTKFTFVFLLLMATKSQAAPCCGGGFAVPTLITGDDKTQFTTSVVQTRTVDDVFSNGVWSKRSSPEAITTTKLEGATLLGDRTQMGLGIPLSPAGIADVTVSGAFEFLPEYEYNLWKPKGFVFVQVVAPTGRSIYESTDPSGLDISGKGFWAPGVGVLFTKVISNFDWQVSADLHHFLPRTAGTQTLKPGWGQSFSFGGGYSLGSLRLGASLTFSAEDAIETTGSINSLGAGQRVATGVASLSYLLDQEWATTLSYSDQRLFGDPTNTALNQSWQLALQKRWPR